MIFKKLSLKQIKTDFLEGESPTLTLKFMTQKLTKFAECICVI